MADNVVEIDLSRSVRLTDLPSLGLAFWHWWSNELLEAMPLRLRQALPQKKRQALLHIDPGIWRITRADIADIAIDAASNETDLSAEIARHCPDIAQYRLIALIRRDNALIRRVRLPMITDARVRPAIELQ